MNRSLIKKTHIALPLYSQSTAAIQKLIQWAEVILNKRLRTMFLINSWEDKAEFWFGNLGKLNRIKSNSNNTYIITKHNIYAKEIL